MTKEELAFQNEVANTARRAAAFGEYRPDDRASRARDARWRWRR